MGRPTFDCSKDQIAPERVENCYFNEEDLVLDADQGLLDPVAQRRLEALFLHPSVRSEVEKELAELSLVTSQRPARKVKEGEAKKPKTSRAEKAASWRVALGKKTIASRLAQLVPYSKEKAQKVKKSFVKKMAKKLKDKGKEGSEGQEAFLGNCRQASRTGSRAAAAAPRRGTSSGTEGSSQDQTSKEQRGLALREGVERREGASARQREVAHCSGEMQTAR